MTIETAETVAGENQVLVFVNDTEVMALYTITNDNRESRAALGDRFVLWRQPSTIYAAELYEAAAMYGMDAQEAKECFHLMGSVWLPSNS